MAFDFKKEYKALYRPGTAPALIDVPEMNYIAVTGAGDPNAEGGAYQKALSVLYAVAYTIRMSKQGGRRIEGYFDYVVPPLEGFWWQPDADGVDYSRKADFHWISAIRLPPFVSRADFDWAVGEAARKKKMDCARAEFMTLNEGLCAQAMHLGPYDDEPATIARLEAFMAENGLVPDYSGERRHHEIYLSDPRRVAPEKLRTVIRLPGRAK